MNLDDKSLLILKPAEAFHQWLVGLLHAAEEAAKGDFSSLANDPVEVSLEDMQQDTTCYIIPALSPEETTAYLEKHTADMFRTELNVWCKIQDYWPSLDFSNFVASFKFDFYFDWMDFQKQEMTAGNNSLQNIILLVKPTERMKEYLRTLLVEKFKVPESEVEGKLDLHLIQNGATAVITDTADLDELDYFLDIHCEEIFTHQLILWGGEDSQPYWPRDLDLRSFKEWFTVDIHRHTYLMAH